PGLCAAGSVGTVRMDGILHSVPCPIQRDRGSEFRPGLAGAPEFRADAMGLAQPYPWLGVFPPDLEELCRLCFGRYAQRLPILRSPAERHDLGRGGLLPLSSQL